MAGTCNRGLVYIHVTEGLVYIHVTEGLVYVHVTEVWLVKTLDVHFNFKSHQNLIDWSEWNQ